MANEDLNKKKLTKKKLGSVKSKTAGKDKIDFNPTTDGTVYETVLTIPQRMKRAMAIRRIEPKLERSREIARRRMAGDKSLRKRSAAAAREIVRRKVAGDRGLRYQELSPSEKIQIDTMTERKIKAIKLLAKKLYPKVRQAEQKRLAGVLNGASAKVRKTLRTVDESLIKESFTDSTHISSLKFHEKMQKAKYSGPYSIKYRHYAEHIPNSREYCAPSGETHEKAVTRLKKMGYDHPHGSGYLNPGQKHGESGGYDSDGQHWQSTRLVHPTTGHTLHVHSRAGEKTRISTH